ncbi:hypothetical protein OBBRIDRAFT_790856 [Obba rivulosa]|uniref:Uncharacterized protein n=1 Tax=Obba rivulosa TaxID=1052685 RepID=A0A8E2DMI4_9APHY|nr:hypothetical protein OBBRIDRAFT_790856 [Obba rivulosa]
MSTAENDANVRLQGVAIAVYTCPVRGHRSRGSSAYIWATLFLLTQFLTFSELAYILYEATGLGALRVGHQFMTSSSIHHAEIILS